MVKYYYSPLCYIYYIIITELPDISKNIALWIAFKVINNFIGPNSFISTLLVFRADLCMVKSNISNFIVIKQIAAPKKAIKEVKKLKAKH